MDEAFFAIKEKFFYSLDKSTVKLLLKDKTTKKNIMWATDHYNTFGEGYQLDDEITEKAVCGLGKEIVRPRITKSKTVQAKRVKNKGEVFTPSWVCNNQNNLVDDDWFERACVFNQETAHGWKTNYNQIEFPEGKTWKEYVDSRRIEITCGEAPYLVSIYDSVTGDYIKIEDRIGILDRKLRIVNENATSDEEWNTWVIRAFQSSYGYEFQGDNLLIARENVFYTYIEYYRKRFSHDPSIKEMRIMANIIAWNIWQMDGLKCVVPFSCNPIIKGKWVQQDLFNLLDNTQEIILQQDGCIGCKTNNIFAHKGIYCKIQDWRKENYTRFIDTLGGKK